MTVGWRSWQSYGNLGYPSLAQNLSVAITLATIRRCWGSGSQGQLRRRSALELR
ncbi:MAG: hypothetical protein VKN60_09200 [Cyanobacteriota bacterium]|nr:hypothetical protein [Cyanobacteriota bacterium]